ncbi:hypothetical protein [Oceanicella actignis]|nr:hypothetical protein [Oceanicella actignis]
MRAPACMGRAARGAALAIGLAALAAGTGCGRKGDPAAPAAPGAASGAASGTASGAQAAPGAPDAPAAAPQGRAPLASAGAVSAGDLRAPAPLTPRAAGAGDGIDRARLRQVFESAI